MRGLIARTIEKMGYNIVKHHDFRELKQRANKHSELIYEFYHLCRTLEFHELPLSIPAELVRALEKLIGTSPYEGVSILRALYGTKGIAGDICEFGIAQGATSRLLGVFLLEEALNKKLVLVDSFEGLSMPTNEDILKDDIFKLGAMEKYAGSMAFPANIALEKLEEIGLPKNQIQIIPGFIQDSIKTHDYPKQVSFAYVDFDLYEPIKIALEYLATVTAKGAVMIIDDYDFFSTGAKKAVDEHIELFPHSYKVQIPPKELGHFCVLTRL